jgi:hypothetical protein
MAKALKSLGAKPVENAFTIYAARRNGTASQSLSVLSGPKTERIARSGGMVEIRFPDNWHKQTGEKDPHPKSGPQFRTNWHPEA